MLESRQNVYFSGLNGLRFLAAFAVIIFHIEQFKAEFGVNNLAGAAIMKNLGTKGVSLFFVLSGFLITYLLMSEIKKTGTVNVRLFYIRRILRIWPLYYLIVIWSFFVFPFLMPQGEMPQKERLNDFSAQLALFVLMLPNLAKVYYQNPLGASQSWTIGVEEQFYLMWPVLMRSFKRNIPLLLAGVIGLKFAADLTVQYLALRYPQMKAIQNFLYVSSIEQMAIGGLVAYFVFAEKERVLYILFHPAAQIFMILGLLYVIGSNVKVPFLAKHIDAAVFALLILNVACNPNSFLKLENKLFNFLGSISYGLYMFHTTMIVITLRLMLDYSGITPNTVSFNVALFGVSVSLTVLISYLSFKYFESSFLRLKDRFTVVKSVSYK